MRAGLSAPLFVMTVWKRKGTLSSEGVTFVWLFLHGTFRAPTKKVALLRRVRKNSSSALSTSGRNIPVTTISTPRPIAWPIAFRKEGVL